MTCSLALVAWGLFLIGKTIHSNVRFRIAVQDLGKSLRLTKYRINFTFL